MAVIYFEGTTLCAVEKWGITGGIAPVIPHSVHMRSICTSENKSRSFQLKFGTDQYFIYIKNSRKEIIIDVNKIHK